MTNYLSQQASGLGRASRSSVSDEVSNQERSRSINVLTDKRSTSVVQRKIIYNYTQGEFGHNSRRPHWRKSLKTWTAGVYNLHKDLKGQGHLADLSSKSNIGARGLARTHKIPFQQLQHFLENFCNNQQTLGHLNTFTDLVIKHTNPAHAAMVVKRNALNVARTAFIANPSANNRFAVIRTANQLLTELHNSIDNVLIGDSARNSGIGSRGDWNIGSTPGGTGRLTPISSEAQHTLAGTPYDPGLHYPNGSFGHAVIASSHITSFEPVAIHPHNAAIKHFTTRNWRGPGHYQNGVEKSGGGQFAPAGDYLAKPI